MNKIRLRGQVAEIRWHTYPAAAVHGYTITRAEATGVVSVAGTVVYQDAFKLAQRPLLFAAPMLVGPPERRRAVTITWPLDTFTIADSGAFTATLGAQKGTSYAPLPVHRPDPRSAIIVVGG